MGNRRRHADRQRSRDLSRTVAKRPPHILNPTEHFETHRVDRGCGFVRMDAGRRTLEKLDAVFHLDPADLHRNRRLHDMQAPCGLGDALLLIESDEIVYLP